MSAYLFSDDLPAVLHFTDLEPLTLREAVKKWMKESSVLSLQIADSAIETSSDEQGLLFNFGAVTVAWVREEPPKDDKWVIEASDTDLEAL